MRKGGLPLMTQSQLPSLRGREEGGEYENQGKNNQGTCAGATLLPTFSLSLVHGGTGAGKAGETF